MTTTPNFENLKYTDGDFARSEDFGDSIYAHEGSFCEKNQSITFDCDGVEVQVTYELDVTAHIIEEAGDYWNPSTGEAVIDNIDININEVFIDDVLTVLDNVSILKIERAIKTDL
jgi:hypothetical protein